MPGTLLLSLMLAAPGLCLAAEAPRGLARFSDSVDVVGDLVLLTPVEPGQPVRIRFPVGELDVAAADVTSVRTALRVRCDRLSEALCAKYRGRLRLEAAELEGTVEVRLAGLPKWKLRRLQLDGEVRVPRGAPLELRVGIGDVDVRSGDESLKVVMGIGDLEIRAPLERVRSVRVATRLGDASLRGGVRHEGRRRMLLGAAVAWSEGEGAADIDVGLRIGDASVVLD